MSSAHAATATVSWVIPNALDALNLEKHPGKCSKEHAFLPYQDESIRTLARSARHRDSEFLAVLGPTVNLLSYTFQIAWTTWSNTDRAMCFRVRCTDRLPVPCELTMRCFFREKNETVGKFSLHFGHYLNVDDTPILSEWCTRSAYVYAPFKEGYRTVPTEVIWADGSIHVDVHACLSVHNGTAAEFAEPPGIHYQLRADMMSLLTDPEARPTVKILLAAVDPKSTTSAVAFRGEAQEYVDMWCAVARGAPYYASTDLEADDVQGAHEHILRRSEWFRTMLSGKMREAADKTIDLRQYDTRAVRLFLLYLYTRDHEALTPPLLDLLPRSTVFDLYQLADMNGQPKLAMKLVEALVAALDVSTLLPIHRFAHVSKTAPLAAVVASSSSSSSSSSKEKNPAEKEKTMQALTMEDVRNRLRSALTQHLLRDPLLWHHWYMSSLEEPAASSSGKRTAEQTAAVKRIRVE